MNPSSRLSRLRADSLATQLTFLERDLDLGFTLLQSAALEQRIGDNAGRAEAFERASKIAQSIPKLLALIQERITEEEHNSIATRLARLTMAIGVDLPSES